MSSAKRDQTLGLSPHPPWGFVPQPGVLWACPPTPPWMALPTQPGQVASSLWPRPPACQYYQVPSSDSTSLPTATQNYTAPPATSF